MKRGISEEGMKRIAKSVGKKATLDDEVWDKIDHIREMLGDDEFIESWIRASSTEEAMANADYIIRVHDLPYGKDEDEDY